MQLSYIFELNGLIKNTRLNKAVLEGPNKKDVSLRVQIEALLIRKDGEKDSKQFDFTAAGDELIHAFQSLEGELIRLPVNVYADERRNINVSLLPTSFPVKIDVSVNKANQEVKPIVQNPIISTPNSTNAGAKPPETK